MSKRLLTATIAALLCLPFVALANNDMTRLVEQNLPSQTSVSLIIQKVGSKQPLVSYNPDLRMLPASVQKLLTATAAIKVLGSDYRFSTRLLTDADISTRTDSQKAGPLAHQYQNGVLAGNLYLVFSGDPALTGIQLARLVSSLKDAGITRIQGDLVLVGDLNRQTKAPGWVWDDLGICYAAPVSSFILDKNCVKGTMQPQQGTDKAKVTLRSNVPFTLDADAYYAKTESDAALCQLSLTELGANHVGLSGCFGKRKAIDLAFAVPNPDQFVADMVNRQLAADKVKLNGNVRFTNASPGNVAELGAVQSPTVLELANELLLESDNLITDSLLLAMSQQGARQTQGKTVTAAGMGEARFSRGVEVMQQTLTELGVSFAGARLVDGSGLSRYNLISASQLAKLLEVITSDPELTPLLASLPLAGETGTLTYKFPYNKAPLKSLVQAKTGSMGGVDNLAGVIHLDGKDYLFVAMENGIVPTPDAPYPVPWHGRILKKLLPLLKADANAAKSATTNAAEAIKTSTPANQTAFDR